VPATTRPNRILALAFTKGGLVLVHHAQTVVIGDKDPEFSKVPERLDEGQVLVDFVRAIEKGSRNGNYDGICW
jgi:hypothetical protein